MAMNVGQTFLDNAEQRQLIVAIQTLDCVRKIKRDPNSTSFCEALDVFGEGGLQADLVQQRRMKKVRHSANVFGHLHDQRFNVAQRRSGSRSQAVALPREGSGLHADRSEKLSGTVVEFSRDSPSLLVLGL